MSDKLEQSEGLRWNVWQALLVVLLYLLLSMILSPIVNAGLQSLGLSLPPSMVSALAVQLPAYTLTLLIVLRKRLAQWSAIFKLRAIKSAELSPVLVMAAGLALLISVSAPWLQILLPIPDVYLDYMEKHFGDVSPFWLLFMVVFFAPVVEETKFRGLLLHALGNRYGAYRAVFYSALLFALLHLNPWQMYPAFCLGLLSGWLFWRCRNLLLCIVLHSAYNFSVGLLAALPAKVEINSATSGLLPILLIPGALLLLAGLWLLDRQSQPRPGLPEAE